MRRTSITLRLALLTSIPLLVLACSNLLQKAETADTTIVQQDQSALALVFVSGDGASSVTQNLALPTTNGQSTTISWASSDPSIISAAGVVTRPVFLAGNATVTLTATLTTGNATSTKTFTVVVISIPPTDVLAVAMDKASLTIGYDGSDSAAGVTQNLHLPSNGMWGTTISWVSGGPAITAAGVVSRPAYASGDAPLTLTATITKGSEVDTKGFSLTVLKLPAGSFTVSFDPNGGSGTMSAQMIGEGQSPSLTSNSFTRAGYTFAGWNTAANGSGTSYANGASYTMGASSVTLYAKWTVNSYTVTFDGQSGSTPTPSSLSATYGSTYGTLATTSRAGYTFDGWWTGTGGNGLQITTSTGISITTDQTVYAKWTANQNTITFNANGGTGTMAGQTIATDASANLTANTFAYTGYAFTGWNTAANGSATAYADGVSHTMGPSSFTLYAQWVPNTNTVSFNANGGTGTMANQTIATDASANLTANAFTHAGYSFTSWNTAANGSGTSYSNGASYTMGTSSITLYAKWTANLNTITFTTNGGTGTMANQTIATDASANLTANAFVRIGYTFSGWNTAANGLGTSYANGVSYTMGASDVTLYAKWTANLNTITFNANGGTGTMANQTIATDASANLTANAFAKTGYSFAGWNTASNGSGTSYANSVSYTMGISSTTLYAQWTAIPYTITYAGNGNTGGTSPATATYYMGQSAHAGTSGTLIKDGKVLGSWNTASDGSGTQYLQGQVFTMPASNLTLYAIWVDSGTIYVTVQ